MLTRLFGLVLLIIVIVAWWYSLQSPKPQDKPYRWLKQRLGGELRRRWLGFSKVLEIEYGDRWVFVAIQHIHRRWHVRVEVRWPLAMDEPFSLLVNTPHQEGLAGSRVALPGLGMPACWVSNEQLARQLLSHSALIELSRLIAQAPSASLQCRIRSNSWELRGVLDEPNSLLPAQWALQALTVHDQMRSQAQSEIAFELGRTLAPQPTCSVCAQRIDADGVQCPRCHSFHHRDCWEYVGHCSRFGCHETRSHSVSVG